MTIEQALNYLLTPSGLAWFLETMLGVIASFLVDWLPEFTELTPRAKRLYLLGGCLVVPVGAVCALGAVGGFVPGQEQLFGALFVGGSVFLGTQAGHATRL